MSLIDNQNQIKLNYNNFFNKLNADEKDVIQNSLSRFKFKKGQNLFDEGTHPLGIYIIHKGKVKIYIKILNKVKILNIIQPDELFSYRSVLAESDQHYSADALEPVEVLVIPKDIILQVYKNNSYIKDMFLQHLCLEIQMYSNLLGSTAFKPVLPRLIDALFALDKLYPEGIKISRENLAGIIGSARETVFRILSELEKDGYIKLTGRKIEISNHAALERISKY